MNKRQWIDNYIEKKKKLIQIQNPNDERLTFISNDDEVKIDEVRANRVWFTGRGDELLNYYTREQAMGFASNPIYNRNKRQYFWAQSAQECDIKRVHSGIPNAIISTLSNVTGMPEIDEPSGLWQEIAKVNDFENKLTQQARPLTMVEGWGAWKPNFNIDLCKYPIWEYYEAENVEYMYDFGLLTGIIFESYYKKGNKNYTLLEIRYVEKNDSYIEYHLFTLKKSGDIEEVSLSELEELTELPNEPIVIPGLNRLLAVPARYFYDSQNPKYGKSIYAGKLDLFDMLDEIWSQASQTNRVSTPVEYYNPDVLDRGKNGGYALPNLYNRQFIKKAGIPDGDGLVNTDIQTTQPDLNFDKYAGLAKGVLDYILTGVLSPATMGIDVAKKDNAEAQREKEKVTIMTRNNIISNETNMLREIVQLSLMLTQFINTQNIDIVDYDINIKYNEFANPSFENQLQTLGSAWSNGEISTEKYVELLWTDKISDEDKRKEIEWLEENKKADNMMIDYDENAIREDLSEQQESEEEESDYQE